MGVEVEGVHVARAVGLEITRTDFVQRPAADKRGGKIYGKEVPSPKKICGDENFLKKDG